MALLAIAVIIILVLCANTGSPYTSTPDTRSKDDKRKKEDDDFEWIDDLEWFEAMEEEEEL